LARTLNLSPQKVRGLKKQIEKKLEYYYKQSNVER
jgi:DNA-binding CsgD family transcriptional regulator